MVETENIGGRRKVIFDPGGDPRISISTEDDLFKVKFFKKCASVDFLKPFFLIYIPDASFGSYSSS